MIAISFNTDLFLTCIIAWIILGAIMNVLCGIVGAEKNTRTHYDIVDIISGFMILVIAFLAVIL